ncbi:MAG: hypothetical protein V7640_1795, partial [Betaproteobacteria bacterium]
MGNTNPFLRLFRRTATPSRVPTGGSYGRSSMQIEEIEPRILHSADLLPIALSSASLEPVEMRIVDAVSAPQVFAIEAEQNTTHEVVFVDVATPDYRQLLDDLREQGG